VLKTIRALARRWRTVQFAITSSAAARIGPMLPLDRAAAETEWKTEGTVMVLSRAPAADAAQAAFSVDAPKAKGKKLHYAVRASVLASNLLSTAAREASTEVGALLDAPAGTTGTPLRALPVVARIKKPPTIIDAAKAGRKAGKAGKGETCV
jgi:hypothetical protein